MPKNAETLNFFFADGPAGYFEDAEYPKESGRYKYVPYRSVYHHKLQQALSSDRPQWCYYEAGDARRYFQVRSPSYGLLELVFD